MEFDEQVTTLRDEREVRAAAILGFSQRKQETVADRQRNIEEYDRQLKELEEKRDSIKKVFAEEDTTLDTAESTEREAMMRLDASILQKQNRKIAWKNALSFCQGKWQ